MSKEIETIVGLPDPTVSNEEKLEDAYGIKWGNYIQSQWFSEESNYYRSRFDKIENNRAYASAQQNEVRYQQLVNDVADESWINLDYKIMSVIPKYVKLITNHIMNLPERVKVEAVDPLSVTSKEEYKKELIGKLYNRDLILEAQEAFGEQFVEDDFIPESMEDINIHMQTKFKPSIEIAMNQAIDLILKLNDYPEETKRQVIEDIIVDGFAGVKVWTDPQYGVKVRRVDPKYAIFNPYKESDMQNSAEYGGEVYQMTIYELKRELGDKYTDDEWKSIARAYSGDRTYNLRSETSTEYSSYLGDYIMDYEKTRVDVLDFAVKSVNKRKFEKKKDSRGNEGFFEKKGNAKVPKKSKFERELKDYDYETVYSGKYILFSNIIFDWGLESNLARDEKDIQKVQLPFKFYFPNNVKMVNRSYVDMMIPPSDQMMLAHIKLQQSVAQGKPTGLAVDLAGLEAVSMGESGQIMSPIELKDIYDATGTMYFRSRSEDGEFIQDPIRPLPNPIQNIPEYITVYNHALENIRLITGITQGMEGIIGDRQAAKTVESSINSSAGAISDVAHAYKRITQKTASHITLAFQDIPNDSQVFKYYKEAIGGSDLKVIEALGDSSIYTLGITVEVDTDMQEQMQLEQDIQLSIQQGNTEGSTSGIELEDAMMVRELAKTDVAVAQKYLMYRRDVFKKEAMQRQQMVIQSQAQANAQSGMAVEQSKQQTMQLELQIYAQKKQIDLQYEQQLIGINAQVDSQKSNQDFQEDMVLKGIEGQAKAQKAMEDKQTKFQSQAFQNQLQQSNILLKDSLGSKQNDSVRNDQT